MVFFYASYFINIWSVGADDISKYLQRVRPFLRVSPVRTVLTNQMGNHRNNYSEIYIVIFGNCYSKFMEEWDYSASFWISNFPICFCEKPRTDQFYDFWNSGRAHDSHHQLFLSLRTPGYLKPPKKNNTIFIIIIAINLERLFGKGGLQETPTIRLINSWRSWIRDQYLPTNMKWKSCFSRIH